MFADTCTSRSHTGTHLFTGALVSRSHCYSRNQTGLVWTLLCPWSTPPNCSPTSDLSQDPHKPSWKHLETFPYIYSLLIYPREPFLFYFPPFSQHQRHNTMGNLPKDHHFFFVPLPQWHPPACWLFLPSSQHHNLFHVNPFSTEALVPGRELGKEERMCHSVQCLKSGSPGERW